MSFLSRPEGPKGRALRAAGRTRGSENKGATVKRTGNAWHPEDPQRAHQEVVSLHTRQPARKPRREVDAPSGDSSQQRCVER